MANKTVEQHPIPSVRPLELQSKLFHLELPGSLPVSPRSEKGTVYTSAAEAKKPNVVSNSSLFIGSGSLVEPPSSPLPRLRGVILDHESRGSANKEHWW